MAKTVITSEEGAELERLKSAYQAATLRASNAIRAKGMDSDEFLKADAEAGRIVERIKEILGTTGNWMA
jgi:hypothetical protein